MNARLGQTITPFHLILFVTCFVMSPSWSAPNNIKLTSSGLCLTQEHKLYSESKRFVTVYSLDECLNRGGRLPISEVTKKKRVIEQQTVVNNTVKQFDVYDWPHFASVPNSKLDVFNFMLEAVSEIPAPINRFNQVTSGQWTCPFSKETLTRARDVRLIHIVPLQFAHDHGGAQWSRGKKQMFANDFTNLVPVSNAIMIERGDRGLAWVPSLNRCWYVKRFDDIMTKYDLRYEPLDKALAEEMLKACG